MPKKLPSVSFYNENGTKIFHHIKVPVPRIGDHVSISDDDPGGTILMEGKVIQVIWVIKNNNNDYGTIVIVEEGRIPDDWV
jgi:hypothetical protein